MNDHPADGAAGPEAPLSAADLARQLSFVPGWARQPPSAPAGGEGKGPAQEEAEKRRERRPPGTGRRFPDRDRRGGPAAIRGGERGARERRGGEARRETAGESYRHEREDLRGVWISFVPDQKRLSGLIHELHTSRKAYPLTRLVALVLSGDDGCCVRIEMDRQTGGGVELFQCVRCKAVATERAALLAHALNRHLEEYYGKEEVLGEPLSGEFVCVGRCGLSGTLLGPPNHHSFAEKLQEVHRARFPGMPLEEYRSRVEMVRDPELVAKWREESRRQTQYRLKGPSGGLGEPVRWQQAEAHFVREIAPGLVAPVRKALVPVGVALGLDDRRLRSLVEEGWRRESRSPRSFRFAVRAAFRNRKLCLFDVGPEREVFSAVAPHPLDPQHTVEGIRRLLLFLKEHPRATREAVTKELAAAPAPEGAPAGETHAGGMPFAWLVEKGHVIEFFDGTLALPDPVRVRPSAVPRQPAAPPPPATAPAAHKAAAAPSGSGTGRA